MLQIPGLREFLAARGLEDTYETRRRFLCRNPRLEAWLEERGLEDTPANRDAFYRADHIRWMHEGRDRGWWALNWDVFPETRDGDLVPLKLTVVDLPGCAHRTFAPLLAELGLFPSAKDAKRNGWGKPLTPGDHLFRKGTHVLRLTGAPTVPIP